MKLKTIIDNREQRILRLELSSFATNAYIVISPDTGESVLIDAPAGAPTILKHLKGTKLKYVLLTHNHVDHIGSLKALRNKVEFPLCVHIKDKQDWLPFPPERLLSGGETMKVGKIEINILFTPGHTPGSVCYRIGDYLFAGDTLFPGGPGRTFGPAEFGRIVKSITEKIFPLPDSTRIFPGHGNSTVLKKEKEKYAVFASRKHPADLNGDVVWLKTV